jgi:hypothetical protein
MDKIKIWAFPVLISVVGWFIVNTLYEIKHDLELVKQDVKTLLAQSNIDKTRIDNLERQVFGKLAGNSSEKVPVPIAKPNHDLFLVREEDIKRLVKA